MGFFVVYTHLAFWAWGGVVLRRFWRSERYIGVCLIVREDD